MTELNTKTLVEIAQKSSTAESFFDYASKRERDVRNAESHIRALRVQMSKEGYHPVPQDLLSMFRELERAGVGVLRGDKFKWNVSVKKLGSAVTETPNAEVMRSAIPTAQKSLVMCFDKHKEVSISFTPNLSKEEIGFLCEKLLKECQ